jgi:hypothetical protein
MRASLALGAAVFASVALAVACESSDPPSTFGVLDGLPDASSGNTSGALIPPDASIGGDGSTSVSDASSNLGDIDVASVRIDPKDAVLTVEAGKVLKQDFKVFAKSITGGPEQDFTSRFVFYVPDNYLVGGFPLDGAPSFATRLPTKSDDPPQRGGKLTVQAFGANSDNPKFISSTSLTVKLAENANAASANPAIPPNPGSNFTGTLDANRAPTLAYPNNGAMIPPNLKRMEVHFRPGNSNALFEVSFTSASSETKYYTRCVTDAAMASGSCRLSLDVDVFTRLADSNRGAGPVKLRVRGGSDNAPGAPLTSYGQSAEFTIEFAESNVAGALYYMNIDNREELLEREREAVIMRHDFGGTQVDPEVYLRPGTNGLSDVSNLVSAGPPVVNDKPCVGCHALSRDGTKMVGSLGGNYDGRLAMIDVTKARGTPGWLLQNGAPTGAPAKNRVTFASFNKDGSEFVAAFSDPYPYWTPRLRPHPQSGVVEEPPEYANYPANIKTGLFLHSGVTGLRTGFIQLPFKPSHPDWSADGNIIAMTKINQEVFSTTTQHPTRGSIALVRKNGATWSAPEEIVPPAADMSRYNPNFVPDGSFLLYNESKCPPGDPGNNLCNGDADPSAKVWAVKPALASTPILMAKASTPGVGDGSETNLGDTYPRVTPFQTKQGAGKLLWYTVASLRSPGLRKIRTEVDQQLLWMFAVDPAKVLAGQDGSYPGFWLPFQDLTTSNHIAQWTEKLAGPNVPPPPPAVPPPPPPPAPPIVK